MADRNDMDIQDSSAAGDASSNRSVLEIDFAKYLECTKNFDATEEQQRELIISLYQIMLAFVDMGFDLNPVQHVSEANFACGQNGENSNSTPETLQFAIQSLLSNDDELKSAFADNSEG